MQDTPPSSSSSSSSSSSCVSFVTFDDVSAVKPAGAASADGGVRFLCSYGGKILPRRHDGQLRYVGGDTRVLAVQRSICFHDLHRRLRELCGWDAVRVRCQLPAGGLDALVSVTSDDDLANLLEEYDLAAAGSRGHRRSAPPQQLRIRAILLPPAGAGTTPRALSTPPLASRRLLIQATHAGSPSPSPRGACCALRRPVATDGAWLPGQTRSPRRFARPGPTTWQAAARPPHFHSGSHCP
ncbi:hypothetical protein ACP70R_018227 [Stipagrostis hirtigluma subsp. patula]